MEGAEMRAVERAFKSLKTESHYASKTPLIITHSILNSTFFKVWIGNIGESFHHYIISEALEGKSLKVKMFIELS